jgi:histidyl-tRNA synthetase
MAKKYKSLRGIRDISGAEAAGFNEIISKASELLEKYGYERIFLPVIEYTNLFARSIGEDTDIVSKEMYSFKDKKGRDISLRPEGTAGAVRSLIQADQLSGKIRRKIYYFGPMFRYERPQKGRYRQFYQLGCEVYSFPSPYHDAEIIEIADKLLKLCRVKDYSLGINSLGCAEDRSSYKKAVKKKLEGKVEKLCPDCRRRLKTNTLRVLDCKNSRCREIYQELPGMDDFLCDDCGDYIEKLRQILDSRGVKYSIDSGLVRGLDYYNGPVFEFKVNDSAVIAGGRYNKLVRELGGPDMPACGWGLGMERLVAAANLEPASQKKAALIKVEGGRIETCRRIADNLRNKGISVSEGYEDISTGKKFKITDKNRIVKVVIIGGEEEKNKPVTLRDMETGKQESVPADDVESLARKILAKKILARKTDV